MSVLLPVADAIVSACMLAILIGAVGFCVVVLPSAWGRDE